MATVAEVKAGILSFSGTDLPNQTLAELATLLVESFGSQWTSGANPYDQETQPTEYAAWPGNATNDQIADFFAAKTVEYWRDRIYRRKLSIEQANAEDAQRAAAQAEAAKI